MSLDVLFFRKPGSDQSRRLGLQASDLKGAESVSAQLSKLLAQRVAALVMLLLVVMPVLSATPTDLSPYAFVENFNFLAEASSSVHICAGTTGRSFLDQAPSALCTSRPRVTRVHLATFARTAFVVERAAMG